MLRRLILFAILTVFLAPSTGLTKDKKTKGNDLGADMEASLKAAEAEAARPGDEKLTCDQLQEELGKTMNNPEMKAFAQGAGEYAQKQQEEMAKAMATQIPLGTATSIVGSVPGGDWVATGARMAQAAQGTAQAKKNMEMHHQQASQAMGAMPTMMRGKRLMDLAQSKKCEWAKDFQ